MENISDQIILKTMKIVSRKALNLNREPGYLIFLTRRISSNTSLDALKNQEVVNLV
jgi:hypothetical protein